MRIHLGICVLFFACVFASKGKNATPLTQAQLDYLKNLKVSQIPRHIRLQILKSVRLGDNSNWCCKNDAHLKVNYTQISKVVSNIIKVADKVQVGSDGCGFLNTHTCNTYDVRYHERVVTHLEYDLVPLSNSCPDEELTCCPGFVPISNYCLENDPDKLNKLVGAIGALQGLLGRK